MSALKKFAELGAHICNEKETELLERTVIDPQTGFMQPMAVGQKATDIARFVGLSVKPNTKLLIAPKSTEWGASIRCRSRSCSPCSRCTARSRCKRR